MLLLVLAALARAAAPGGAVDVWVPAGDLPAARAAGFAWVEERRGGLLRLRGPADALDALDRARVRWRPAPEPPAGAGRDPAAIDDALAALEEAWPELARRVEIGWSVEGRAITALVVGTGDAPEAAWRVVGGHHGDEGVGADVALAVAEDLLERADDDPEVAALLADGAVWVVPAVNPDGLAAGTRANARGVDLNRNYDYRWSADEWASGDGPFSEPETRAQRALADWTPFAAGLTMHAGAANIGWVWNWTTKPAPDAPLLEALAEAYAGACGAPGFWTTNGAEWYVTRGDLDDWSYGRHGTLDFTVEVSEDKAPDDPEAVVGWHLDAVRAFLAWAPAVRGRVVDAETGRGIRAVVRAGDEAWPLVTGPDGRFARPVGDDAVELVVSAPGYAAATLSAGAGDVLEIALERAELLTSLEPEPRLLSRGGDGRFRLDVEVGTVRLVRSGHESVPASPAGDGAWSVDLDRLAPGPWSLEVDGAVAPRAIFVGELDEAVEVQDVASGESPGLVEVLGAGFGLGTRAWALVGPERAAVELEVRAEASDRLVLDASSLPDDAGTVDLVVLSAGRQVVALDALGDVLVDGDAPAAGAGEEEAGGADEAELTLRGCASAPAPRFPGAGAAVTLAFLLSRRRRR